MTSVCGNVSNGNHLNGNGWRNLHLNVIGGNQYKVWRKHLNGVASAAVAIMWRNVCNIIVISYGPGSSGCGGM